VAALVSNGKRWPEIPAIGSGPTGCSSGAEISVGPRKALLPSDRSESRKSNDEALRGCPNWNALAAFRRNVMLS
jgi:hypothetical protein